MDHRQQRRSLDRPVGGLEPPEAREAVSRARYCAWLLEEGGLPVRTITTSREREVIWRDAHQIVTKPSADLPKAFPERRKARWR